MANVLVVEDDWMHRDFLVRLLQIKGYEVRVAVSGEDAISDMRHSQPDAVVLDMGLPGISGYQVARLIRTTPATSHIPIIALTAFALGEDYDRAIKSGCDAFETKPVDLDALHAKLQSLISRQSASLS
jgi:two-component system, cell cycle response regulator DivK